jgi:hypothetical protein
MKKETIQRLNGTQNERTKKNYAAFSLPTATSAGGIYFPLPGLNASCYFFKKKLKSLA